MRRPLPATPRSWSMAATGPKASRRSTNSATRPTSNWWRGFHDRSEALMANPLADPLANPLADPLVDPLVDPVLNRIVPALATVPGVAAIALGGSRARGTANEASDYDIGLYYSAAQPINTDALRQSVRPLVNERDAAEVTSIGGWGPWIVGGGWLTVDGHKVDLIYRNLDDVGRMIDACRAGEVTMHYQPGHPHGFCSSIWMGEVALCRLLHDKGGLLAALKAKTAPYPSALRESLIKRFQWE